MSVIKNTVLSAKLFGFTIDLSIRSERVLHSEHSRNQRKLHDGTDPIGTSPRSQEDKAIVQLFEEGSCGMLGRSPESLCRTSLELPVLCRDWSDIFAGMGEPACWRPKYLDMMDEAISPV